MNKPKPTDERIVATVAHLCLRCFASWTVPILGCPKCDDVSSESESELTAALQIEETEVRAMRAMRSLVQCYVRTSVGDNLAAWLAVDDEGRHRMEDGWGKAVASRPTFSEPMRPAPDTSWITVDLLEDGPGK